MINSRLCSRSQSPTHVLLSIRPEFLPSIFCGDKKYEFRRRIFARPVDVVLVYATAPIQRVVGEFDVRSVVTEPLQTLWELTRQLAGIEEYLFLQYFRGMNYGHAIEIGEVRRYATPLCPVEQLGVVRPQSFVYLGDREPNAVTTLCDTQPAPQLDVRTNRRAGLPPGGRAPSRVRKPDLQQLP